MHHNLFCQVEADPQQFSTVYPIVIRGTPVYYALAFHNWFEQWYPPKITASAPEFAILLITAA